MYALRRWDYPSEYQARWLMVDAGWNSLSAPFIGAKWLHLAGDFSTDIALALYRSDMRRETFLPAMYKLCIREPEPHCASLRMAVVSFMVPRWLSGHLIAVEYEVSMYIVCPVPGPHANLF